MRDLTVPSNWAHLVANSRELVTTEQYDLTKTWFVGQDDPSADSIIQPPVDDPLSNLHNAINLSHADTMPNEGDAGTASHKEETAIGSSKAAATSDSTSNEGGSDPPVFCQLRWADEWDKNTATVDSTPVSEGDDALGMPGIVNLQ